jgi:arylsulfatase A
VSLPGDRVAIRIGDWKLVGNDTLTEFQLYDIQKDWREEHDLAASMPAKTEEMKTRLFAVWTEIESEGPNHWWKSERQNPVQGGVLNY